MCIYDHFKGQYRHTRIADAYITSTKPTNQNFCLCIQRINNNAVHFGVSFVYIHAAIRADLFFVSCREQYYKTVNYNSF